MKQVKLADLWAEVESALTGDRASSIKYAILEAHKILENTLNSKGYPGRTIEKKLYWAGYSLEDEGGIKEALQKRAEILDSFDFQISDLEAAEIISLYKKIVHEIAHREPYSLKSKIEAFYKVYLSPRSVYAWRNLVIIFGSFLAIKIMAYTEFGKSIVSIVVYLADLALSWFFVALLIVIIIAVLVYTNYHENKTKIRIKED